MIDLDMLIRDLASADVDNCPFYTAICRKQIDEMIAEIRSLRDFKTKIIYFARNTQNDFSNMNFLIKYQPEVKGGKIVLKHLENILSGVIHES